MKHPIGAVFALALGVSLAAAAQAQMPQRDMAAPPNMAPAASAPLPQAPTTGPESMPQAQTGRAIPYGEAVRMAQQALKAEGFYNGKIDGIWGPKSRQALMRFEERHNMPATGNLDSDTLSALIAGTTGNTGSTMPPQPGMGANTVGSGQAMPGRMHAPVGGGRTAPDGISIQR